MAHVAKWWMLALWPDWLRRRMQQPEEMVGRWVHEGMAVADVGCGLGFLTLPMAEMVGAGGRVLAVDLQEAMLSRLERRARREGLLERIELRQCGQRELGLDGGLDFAVSLNVAHEVPDAGRFFAQIRAALKGEGRYLLIEPIFHVPKGRFEGLCELAQGEGLWPLERPVIASSRAVLFGPG